MGDALTRKYTEKEWSQIMTDALLNIDLNARFIRNKAATLIPLTPDDGIHGVFMNDFLIVDRSIKPKPGHVIFAIVDGEHCLRRLVQEKGKLYLVDDKGYVAPRLVTDEQFNAGVVTYNIHSQVW